MLKHWILLKEAIFLIKKCFKIIMEFLTPASTGVASKGFGKKTGSPEFSTVWTYMGLPAISLPLLTGENNLPLGIQLIGNKYDDLRFYLLLIG